MRKPSAASSWWKRTGLRCVADYSLTGTVTRPKEIAPVQIDLGMRRIVPYAGGRHPPTQENLRKDRRAGYALAEPLPLPAVAATSCSPSANSSIILSLNAG